MTANRSKAWTVSEVNSTKQRVRAAIESHQKPTARIRYIQSQIAELATVENAASALERYVLCVSAIVHWIRFGGGERTQIETVYKTAHTILIVQGIDPRRSALRFLFEELYSALSQIFWNRGEFWQAAWTQQIASLHGKTSDTQDGFSLLSRGVRYFGIGELASATTLFKQAEDRGLPEQSMLQARCFRIRALRLVGRDREALNLRIETEQHAGASHGPVARELVWEKACLDIYHNQSLVQVLQLVGKGKPHFRPAFILEAWLWTRAVEHLHYLDRIPKIRYLNRDKALALSKRKTLRDAALALENCYEEDIPKTTRLMALGEALENLMARETIDIQCLFLVGAVRWLARNKVYDTADLLLSMYGSKSLTITGGKSHDCLNIAGDLLTKPWRVEERTQSTP